MLTGWITAEVGRQPWVVYGHLRTADAVSPIPAESVATSLTAFFLAYMAIFGAGTYYMLRLIAGGPDLATPWEAPTPRPARADQRPKRPLSALDERPVSPESPGPAR